MPNDVIAFVNDKSSWARQGLAVQNTVIEPGWRGYLTIELSNHLPCSLMPGEREQHSYDGNTIHIFRGDPIAQIVFHKLDYPTEKPYEGKYQDQEAGPQKARLER
jgi:dCTP deaminase